MEGEDPQQRFGEASTDPAEVFGLALPTPPCTPPSAYLAGAVPGADPVLTSDQGKDRPGNVTWKATFYSGSHKPLGLDQVEETMTYKKAVSLEGRDLKSLTRQGLPPLPRNMANLRTTWIGKLVRKAEEAHLQQHRQTNTWREILTREHYLKGKEVLDCQWVRVYKFTKHRRFVKIEPRLVVRGDQQTKDRDANNYAATVAGKSFRTLIAIANRFNLEMIQYDAVNAFVNASLDEEIYMKMPPGYRKRGVLLWLQKALYGLRKSPLLWQRHLTSTLTEIGFQPAPHEPCAFIKGDIIIFFYVDDIIIAYRKTKEAKAKEAVSYLQARYDLTGGSELQWFLGIRVIRDRQEKKIWLSQKSYIEKIFLLADGYHKVSAPMGREELRPFEGEATAQQIHSYQRKIGSLLYAAVNTRPDVAFAVSRLARFIMNPGPVHHIAADRVLSYLYNTANLALEYGRGNDLRVASDASFADNTVDRKSSQAYIMMLFGGIISWRANKQATVTTLTTEAELLALNQAAREGLFIGRLLRELKVRLIDHRIRIECDNTQTIKLVNDKIATLKTQLRHVDIHNHWLRQEAQKERITVVYTKSAEMIADGLTKALTNTSFTAFLKQLNMVNISEILERLEKVEEMEDPTEDVEEEGGVDG